MNILGKSIIFSSISFLSTAAVSCDSLPENVIPKDRMIDVLTDIHKGESVIEMQRGYYRDDSLKKVMKQSVLLRHGITQEMLDTSFVWYGNHIEDYIEVYDGVIARLEEEAKTAKRGNFNQPVFAEGDSIDVWPFAHTYRINDKMPLDNIVFDLPVDQTWKEGDNYQLQYRIVNNREPNPQVKSVIFAEYDDGKVEFRSSTGIIDGWTRVRLVTDSMKLPQRIYGSISFDISDDNVVMLDSISMVRTRNRRDNYYQRNAQRYVDFSPEKEEQSDTIAH